MSFDEIRNLINLDLKSKPQLGRVRDMFVVGCFTGLRQSNWDKINKETITVENEIELLEILTTKTKTLVYIPLLPPLKKVLLKYDYKLPITGKSHFGRKIKIAGKMILGDAAFNKVYSRGGLILGKVTEKWKVISSHVARRLFATNFFELGISVSILMQITGHTTEKQFFDYIDVDQKKLALTFAEKVKNIQWF